jgi:hypothetical protein
MQASQTQGYTNVVPNCNYPPALDTNDLLIPLSRKFGLGRTLVLKHGGETRRVDEVALYASIPNFPKPSASEDVVLLKAQESSINLGVLLEWLYGGPTWEELGPVELIKAYGMGKIWNCARMIEDAYEGLIDLDWCSSAPKEISEAVKLSKGSTVAYLLAIRAQENNSFMEQANAYLESICAKLFRF